MTLRSVHFCDENREGGRACSRVAARSTSTGKRSGRRRPRDDERDTRSRGDSACGMTAGLPAGGPQAGEKCSRSGPASGRRSRGRAPPAGRWQRQGSESQAFQFPRQAEKLRLLFRSCPWCDRHELDLPTEAWPRGCFLPAFDDPGDSFDRGGGCRHGEFLYTGWMPRCKLFARSTD